MSKLLFIFERDMPTVSITRDVFSSLKNYPDIVSSFRFLIDITAEDIDNADVLIMICPTNNLMWRIARRAREAGHLVVAFCDDDLLNLPPSVPSTPWRRKGLLYALKNSDVILSTSKLITEKYKGLTAGKREALIDTIIRPDDLETPSFSLDKPVKIVYAAASSHSAIFDKYIKPIIYDLAERFSDGISLTFVGVHPDIEGITCNYVKGMPLEKYRAFMRNTHFDIGLAPLIDDEFSKCKYFNKFLEYTMHGIVGIYANSEPYTRVVKDGINGFLADYSPASWYDAICKAVSDAELRRKCLYSAIDFVKKELNENACMNRLLSGIPEIRSTTAVYKKYRNVGCFHFRYHFIRIRNYAYLSICGLKQGGISGLFRKIKSHLFDDSYKKS